MTLIRLSGPPELCVSLAEAKATLRVASEDHEQDAMIMGLVRAAQDYFDGARGVLGRALTTQQWRLSMDTWPWTGVVEIALPPLASIDAVVYVDPDGVTKILNDYRVHGIGSTRPARVTPAYGSRWPATRCQGDAVVIDFTAGTDLNGVPESVRHAILLKTAELYDGCSHGDAVDALTTPHRVW